MRGDVYELRSNKHSQGHEQHGRRYAVVLQSDSLALSTVLAAPTTTGSWDAPFHPEIKLMGKRTRILIEQLQGVDPEHRFGRKVGHVTEAEQDEIDEAVKLMMGLF